MSLLHSETNTTVKEWAMAWLTTDSNPRGFVGSAATMLDLHERNIVKRDVDEVNLLTTIANLTETGLWKVNSNGTWVRK
jgi:hypothetical protein